MLFKVQLWDNTAFTITQIQVRRAAKYSSMYFHLWQPTTMNWISNNRHDCSTFPLCLKMVWINVPMIKYFTYNEWQQSEDDILHMLHMLLKKHLCKANEYMINFKYCCLTPLSGDFVCKSNMPFWTFQLKPMLFALLCIPLVTKRTAHALFHSQDSLINLCGKCTKSDYRGAR